MPAKPTGRVLDRYSSSTRYCASSMLKSESFTFAARVSGGGGASKSIGLSAAAARPAACAVTKEANMQVRRDRARIDPLALNHEAEI